MIFGLLKPLGFDLSRFDAPLAEIMVPYITLQIGLKTVLDRYGNPVTGDKPAGTKAFVSFLHHVYLFGMALLSGFILISSLYAVIWESVLNGGKGPINFSCLLSGGFFANKGFADASEHFIWAARVAVFAEPLFKTLLAGGSINDTSLLDHFRAVGGVVAYTAAVKAKCEFMYLVILVASAARLLDMSKAASEYASKAPKDGLAAILKIPDFVPLGIVANALSGSFFNVCSMDLALSAAQAGLMRMHQTDGDAFTMMAAVVGVSFLLALDAEMASRGRGVTIKRA